MGSLFRVGGVHFFQAAAVEVPIDSYRFDATRGHYLSSNEPELGRAFHEVIAGRGGTYLGAGSWQNLGLAAAAQATGLILVDQDPTVALWHLLTLPHIPRLQTPTAFNAKLRSLFLVPSSYMDPFLRSVPEPYQPVLRQFVLDLHREEAGEGLARQILDGFEEMEGSFLRDKALYERIADLVDRGRVAVIHGDLFGEEMLGLSRAASQTFPDPVRLLYASNAPSWAAGEYGASSGCRFSVLGHPQLPIPAPKPSRHFLQFLHSTKTDPKGELLFTTGTLGRVAYHHEEIGRAADQLREGGGFREWLLRRRAD